MGTILCLTFHGKSKKPAPLVFLFKEKADRSRVYHANHIDFEVAFRWSDSGGLLRVVGFR